jgi:predicted enzyme related to lactoylglutathione lyase
MRAVICGLTLTVLGAGTQVLRGQSLPADVGPGRVAWFDLSTTDLARSKAFYGQLFGWGFTPVQGTDQAAEIVAGGTPIGTLRAADGSISVFNGVVYVQVSDLRASCEQAKALGGTIAPGFPFDLPGGIGAIALVVDPGGHPIGLYSRTPLATGRPQTR